LNTYKDINVSLQFVGLSNYFYEAWVCGIDPIQIVIIIAFKY